MKIQGFDEKQCLQVLIEGLNLDHYTFLGNGPVVSGLKGLNVR